MDPTKPILNLDSANTGCFYRDVIIKPVEKVTFEDKYQQLEHQRNFYKQYQRLYQAYQELKVKLQNCQHLKSYIADLQGKIELLGHQTRGGDSNEVRILRQDNQKMKQALVNKNDQLTDMYNKIKNTGRNQSGENIGISRRVLGSVDKLQDGIRQAIFSNFELLKNNSIGQLKNLIRNHGQIGHVNEPIRQYVNVTNYGTHQTFGRGATPVYQANTLPRY